jgi:hypothetical protein
MKIQTNTNPNEPEPRLDMAVLPLSIDQAADAHRTLRASSARAGSGEKAFAGRPEQRIDGEKSIQAGQMQVREMTIMATPAGPRVENAPFMESDKIVRRLDEFPDLNRALRTGDVPTARLLCAQLFNPQGREALALAVRSKAS